MSHTLAIITVIYENYNVFDEFLNSLSNQAQKDFHLFAADASKHKEKISSSTVPLTVIPIENHGYAYGVNRAIEAAIKQGYSFFCVMNNDTYFQNTFTSSVLKTLTDHPHALIGGKIYYAPGFEYHKDRYTKQDLGNIIWYAGGTVDWDHAFTKHRGVDEVDNKQYDTFENTDFITGCLICFDKSVVDTVGLWDETYFLYYEDADYCERAKHKHIPLYYDPTLTIWHKVSSLTGGSGSTLHEHYQNKNRVIYGLKYAPLRTKFHLVKNFIFDRFKKR